MNSCRPFFPLKIQDLCFVYRHEATPVLQNINATIEPGQFIGLLGPNGTGKSTFLRLIAGLLAPTRGRVCFSVSNPGAEKLSLQDVHTCPKHLLARELAFVPQDVRLWLPFTCREVVAMGRYAHHNRFSFFRSDENDEIVLRCMRDTQIDQLADRLVTEISGGEAQRVRIAQALAQEACLIILDEPTSHLDIKHQVGIMEMMSKMRDNCGITVIAALHDLNLAALYCDRLLVLKDGQLAFDGVPAQVLTAANIRSIFGVSATVECSSGATPRIFLEHTAASAATE